jgi:hypothetical protein
MSLQDKYVTNIARWKRGGHQPGLSLNDYIIQLDCPMAEVTITKKSGGLHSAYHRFSASMCSASAANKIYSRMNEFISDILYTNTPFTNAIGHRT